jgi:hypothetical protein
MKKTIPFLLLIGALAFGCSKSETASPSANSLSSADEAKLNATVVQNSMIVNTTQTGCTWCGYAGKPLLESIAQTYTDKVAILNVHPGPSFSGVTDPMYSTAGLPLKTYFEKLPDPLTGFPDIRVNFNTNIYGGGANYTTVLDEALAATPAAGVNLVQKYDAATSTLNVTYRVKSLGDLSGDMYNLALYLTEDGIEAPQATFDASNKGVLVGMTHDGVFRTASGGTWGVTIPSANMKSGGVYTGTAAITMKSSWVPTSCKAHAVIFKMKDARTVDSYVNSNWSK